MSFAEISILIALGTLVVFVWVSLLRTSTRGGG
jgi:hypothetical protein